MKITGWQFDAEYWRSSLLLSFLCQVEEAVAVLHAHQAKEAAGIAKVE